MVLPDTSIWVAYLRHGAEELTRELSEALERREVLVCGPVVTELVAGARAPDRPTLLETMAGLRWAELDHRSWQSVGLVAAELRASGWILPLTDLQIAVAAHISEAVLWTADRDFERVVPHLEGLNLRLTP